MLLHRRSLPRLSLPVLRRVYLAQRWAALVVLTGALCACSSGDRLVGYVAEVRAPGSEIFSAPVEIRELTDPSADQQDPTLTRDELEIFFTRIVAGAKGDIWTSTRAAASDPWAAPHRVAELSTDFTDSTPEVSADGLSLYFASDRPDGVASQLWSSQRVARSSPWSVPTRLTNPTPAPGSKDLSPSLDDSGLWLAMGSIRDGTSSYDLFITSRSTPNEPWGPWQPLTSLSSTSSDFDPALFLGATHIVFNSRRDDEGDLFQATRTASDQPFSAPSPINELNSLQADSDPWLSADGRHIYFASNRSGVETMYRAARSASP